MINERTRSLLIYILKCALGTITVFAISFLIHYKNIAWSLISVLLVLSPEGKDAISLAMNRIKANVVGAGSGLCCLLVAPSGMWMLCLGIALTLTLCYLFRLETGARSAMAAVVIIMLRQEGTHVWNTALERVAAVFAGCILGLIITFIFHLAYKPHKDEKAAVNPAET